MEKYYICRQHNVGGQIEYLSPNRKKWLDARQTKHRRGEFNSKMADEIISKKENEKGLHYFKISTILDAIKSFE